MTIENTLERIANALERIVAVQETTVSLRVPAGDFAAAVEASRNEPGTIMPLPAEPTEPVVATEVVRRRGRPRKDEVKREELQEKPATADAPPAAAEPPPADEPTGATHEDLASPAATAPAAPTEDQVKNLILSLVAKVGRGPVAAVLAADPFKATRFGTIDPRHRGLLYQRLVELDAADPLSL